MTSQSQRQSTHEIGRWPSSGPEATTAAVTSSLGSAAFFGPMFQGPYDAVLPEFNRPSAKVYLPLQYSHGADQKKWPVVVLLHGFSGTAETEDLYLTLRFRVSSRGFILVTPDGLKMPQGTRSPEGRDVSGNQFWNAMDSCCDFGKTGVDDVGYLAALVHQVKKQYNVDASRVYLFGHSNGGFMANRLACEIGDEIAGVANLAGGGFKNSESCRAPVAMPYLQIHAENDKTINYVGTAAYAGGVESVAQWTRRNDCRGPSKRNLKKDFLFLIPEKDTSIETWVNCQDGNDVAFWKIKAFEAEHHNAHVLLFNLNFTESVLDFLLSHRRAR